ncbi:MAG: DNA-3-methyladenine glycosylase 2 family protein [Candidatus Dormibacteraeota bacterium]|nr:DNA-3-methyladenine glycosylase 2 family protein [Candidatus Dormibacteraeota bacterium]
MGALPGPWSATVEHRLDAPVDLVATMSPLRQGVADPTFRALDGTVWRAFRTTGGAATLELRIERDRLVTRAAGPGAVVALCLAPGLAGLNDDPTALRALHAVVRDAQHRNPGLRLTAGTSVLEALVWTVLAQKVVGMDARRAYRDLVRRLGEPAPGVDGMMLPPSPEALAAAPYWVFHQCNVELRRARVISDAARRAVRLDALGGVAADAASAGLRSLPGVGPWTAAETVAVTHGDPDAVAEGDYHLPNVVSWALAGEPRGDDARMLELLEPYKGQRGRVIRLLLAGGGGAPRWGPPMPRRSIRRL